MSIPKPTLAVGVFFFLALSAPGQATYSIKTTETAPPKELKDAIRGLIGNNCVQLHDGKGDLLLEVWFRKEVPVKATEAQFKNGLTYREVPVSTVVGAMRVVKTSYDYRKQKVKAGVYTLRLAAQPQDGDHMGTAPYSEFCLVCPAAEDGKPELLETKKLHELSALSTESHPGVFLLFPGKEATKEAKLVNKGMGHWLLLLQLDARSGDLKGVLPLGLVLIGTSASA